jgi:transcriptional regulator with XRE-family HTH domain
MLHKALRHLRRYHQMTQEQLASRLEISNNYLSEIESGKKAHALTVDLLERYSKVFDVPVSSLMLFSEQLDSNRRSEKVRVAIASKVLKVMDWIDADEKSVTQT